MLLDKCRICENKDISCAEMVIDTARYGVMWEDPVPGVDRLDLDRGGSVLKIMSVESVVNMKRLAIRESHPDANPTAEELLSDFCVCNWIDLKEHVLEFLK